MRKSLLYCLTLAVVCAPAVWAQGQGGGGGGGGGNTGGQQPSGEGGGGRGGQSPGQGQQPGNNRQQRDPFGNQQQQQQQRMERRPVFLSGKVVLEDGTPPPEPAVIERVCHGQVRPEAYTDSRGNFSFELGGDQTLAMTDASVSASSAMGNPFGTNDPFGGGGAGMPGGGMGQVNLTGCDIRVQLSGYRSDVISLGRRSVFDNPNVGTIVLHRLDGVSGTAVSATSLAAPKKAKKAYQNGIKEMRKKKPNAQKAEKQFEKAVEEYPQYASAWGALGQLRLSLDNMEGAQEAFEKALEADPKYLNPYQPLVRMHLMGNRWEPALELADQALQLNPYMTDLQYFKAVALLNAGRMEEAEKAALAVQESKEGKDFPQTHQILGMIQAEKGNFNGAAEEYRSYLALQSEGAVAEDLKRRLTEWEALGVIEKAPAAPAGAITAVKE